MEQSEQWLPLQLRLLLEQFTGVTVKYSSKLQYQAYYDTIHIHK